ncbi:3'-5' exonuclease [Bradyrhizobium sp. AZCC 2289]|uniref:3'-5' exonuclease n=1 Tax=Bradyrhizobium sp. AZCC 2289 TaxID=3117026 RepID=UPI002FF17027
MTTIDQDLAAMAQTLEESGEYRVLRRLAFRQRFSTPTELTKVGILLDVETTGLDTASDEVVELGMVKFSYHPDGTVAAVLDRFSSLNEPIKTIPEEAIKLHGITNEMAAGHKIDGDSVTAFASDAAIIIAHNAAFDRKFAERYWPIFATKPWACSVSQIEWRAHGFEGSRLGYLLNGIGLFHRSHRAVDDCHALLEILAHTISGTERTALSLLLENARRKTIRIWAEQAPFDLKDELKKRGYRWSPGDEGRPKAWYVDIDEAKRDDEIAYLRQSIYLRDVDLFEQTLSALDRFSIRI